MQLSIAAKEKLQNEISYSATKNSGPGGQNVNKVNTSVELRFNVSKSAFLSDIQKQIILGKVKNKINADDELIMVSRNSRSQLQNKVSVTEKFFQLLEKVLTQPKKRKKTKPTLTSRKKRMKNKKNQSEKKELRKPPSI